MKALEEGRADVIQSAPSQAFHIPREGRNADGRSISRRSTRWTGSSSMHRPVMPIRTLIGRSSRGRRLSLSAAASLWRCSNMPVTRRASISVELKVINVGGAEEMDKAFRDGKGQYVQQQGPFPQQLEADGVGHIVAECGPKIGPVAFSSLAATREWLGSDVAKAFMRAYSKTRAYMVDTPAIEIARAEKSFFPGIELDVLARCISGYQQLGCWTRHVEITRPAFEVALDVFEHFGSVKERYKFDQVCARCPHLEGEAKTAESQVGIGRVQTLDHLLGNWIARLVRFLPPTRYSESILGGEFGIIQRERHSCYQAHVACLSIPA